MTYTGVDNTNGSIADFPDFAGFAGVLGVLVQ
jgi:hypothetical protein